MSFLRKRGQSGEEEHVSTSSNPTSVTRPIPRPAIFEKKGESRQMANIGKSISIKGDVTGDEDTVIEGRVEGRIELKNHHLTVGPNGDVKGEINAKQVTVVGKVAGNISATERIELSDSGRVEGDLASPRLLIQEGALLTGSVEMKGAPVGATTQPGKGAPPLQPQKKIEPSPPRPQQPSA
jgi:cytoskeletal protein CcmA (bactofilin family)